MTLQSRGFVRSHDKLTTLCLNYHNAYGHKIRLSDDLPCVTPTHEVT